MQNNCIKLGKPASRPATFCPFQSFCSELYYESNPAAPSRQMTLVKTLCFASSSSRTYLIDPNFFFLDCGTGTYRGGRFTCVYASMIKWDTHIVVVVVFMGAEERKNKLFWSFLTIGSSTYYNASTLTSSLKGSFVSLEDLFFFFLLCQMFKIFPNYICSVLSNLMTNIKSYKF